MLDISGLHVQVGGESVLQGVDLRVGAGETHVLVGPNGCGKTSLALTILGYPSFEVTGGRITFEGADLAGTTVTERARMGIAMAHQAPPEIRGVKMRDVIRLAAGHPPWDPAVEEREGVASPFMERLGLESGRFLHRDVNCGFSGGEKKRSELAQVFAMSPKLMLLDEPDSGVDIDSIRLIGPQIGAAASESGSALLVITHHRHILEYLRPEAAHVMSRGKIVTSGEPEKVLSEIEQRGYWKPREPHLKGAC